MVPYKVKNPLVRHAESEKAEGRNIDYTIPKATPKAQADAAAQNELCRLVGTEYECR